MEKWDDAILTLNKIFSDTTELFESLTTDHVLGSPRANLALQIKSEVGLLAFRDSKNERYLDLGLESAKLLDENVLHAISNQAFKLPDIKYDQSYAISQKLYMDKYSLSNNAQFADKIIECAEKIRTLFTLDLRAQHAYGGDDLKLGTLLRREKAIQDLVKYKKGQLLKPIADQKTINLELDSLNEILIATKEELKSDHEEFYLKRYNFDYPTLREIQQKLTARQKLICYSQHKDELVILKIGNDDFDPEVTYAEDLGRRISGFIELIVKQDSFNSALSEVQQVLVGNENFDQIDELIIIPAGNLGLVPFELLVPEHVVCRYAYFYIRLDV